LLVLAIVASSTLVFTNRVELLRLAVVLSLWAAVMAAFVTVIYRRQTDVAQARARDMKHVYDLQLDREISARREYEAAVEAQLRRQLSREVRAQAADEMGALRAELASLRAQLEVMLGTDLGHRPALEGERVTVAMAPPMPPPPDRVESSRVTVISETIVTEARVTAADDTAYILESPIIDVAEEPLTPVSVHEDPAATQAPPAAEPQQPSGGTHRRPEPPAERYLVQPVAAPGPPPAVPPEAPPWRPPEVRLGRHATAENAAPPTRPEPPAPPRGRHWVAPEAPSSPAGRHRGPSEATAGPSVGEPVVEPDQPQGQHADGQSFSELLQRLQTDLPSGGGRRRRRED
ncbi:MAG: hypothetical protein FGM52_11385, partial [Mycobacterium sp.]|nr:hypothetical protein [Mycobacterium sp.]